MALSIQRLTMATEGSTRTSLRLVLAATILSTNFCWVAVLEFLGGFDANGKQQLGVFPPDAFDPHTIRGSHPTKHVLVADPDFLGNPQALLRRFARAEKADRGANSLPLQEFGGIGSDGLNFTDGICRR